MRGFIGVSGALQSREDHGERGETTGMRVGWIAEPTQDSGADAPFQGAWGVSPTLCTIHFGAGTPILLEAPSAADDLAANL